MKPHKPLYIRIRTGKLLQTQMFGLPGEQIMIDTDAKGRVLGVEILDYKYLFMNGRKK